MRRLDLTPYATSVRDIEAQDAATPNLVNVAGSCVALLFAGKHAPREMLARDALATRIEQAASISPAEILLEESEWKWLIAGLEDAKPSGRQFIGLIQRILEAPSVSVRAVPTT